MLRAAVLLLLAASAAAARPPYRKALADLLDRPADCSACHLPEKDDERPHNAFGARLKAVRAKGDITARVLAVADEDADGDGAANLLELLAGTAPGDAASRPDAKAQEAARERRVKFMASLGGYRWRPFERVTRPEVPAAFGTGPIDAFLQERRRGLTPMPEAPRPVLLRRVTLDLTGLPPSPEEVQAFVNDARPDAYERLVDRLLASPAFGERWGRHWMDVWRYADWAGFGAQVRDSQPHVWRWRDWILEALDEDKPYSRMVVEMLAADEAAPDDERALRATGFLVRNYKLLSRERWLQDAVDHSAMAFLGLTLGCARCHDHMYEAVTQKEYFQVRAVFAPHNVRTDRVPDSPDGLPRAFDADAGAKTFLLLRGDDRTPGKEALAPGVPELLGGKLDVKPVTLPAAAYDPDGRAFLKTQVEARRAAALVAVATNPAAGLTRLAARESPRKTYPTTSTGRRLAYANWITSPDNPLAARVAVNHVWARHFGTGIVPGMFDFGKNAPPATHPALLDWLAAEFMEGGWSLKALHRRIVLSAAYRADSRPSAEGLRRDPDNVWLWRFAPRRAEAEVVRDSLLFVSGALDRRRGGPEVPFGQALASPRRSVYVQSGQEKQAEFLLLFDCASVTEAYQRKQAIMPGQALALLNSEAAVESARRAAGRVEGDGAAFVRGAFGQMLGREPSAEEVAECVAFLKARGARGKENLLRVLINHHEFVTIR